MYESSDSHSCNDLGDAAPSWLYVLGWELAYVGGVNEVVKNMFDRTARRLHHRPILLVRKWGQRSPVTAVEDGRTTISTEIRSPWDPHRRRINLALYMLGLPRMLARLLAIVREQRIAMIHVHFPDLHALTWLLVRTLARGEVRVVLSFHGLDLKSALAARGLVRIGWSVLLRASDCNIVCSQGLREQLIAAFPHCGARVYVVDNGVDVESLERARHETPTTALPSSFIMSIGTYESKKGHDVLIAAFDRVASRNASVVLVIVGRYSAEEYAKLVSLKETLTSKERILLLKELQHPEVMRVLARADVFALASRDEPFGIAILEAAVLSRPVVATDVCGAVRLLSPDTELLTVPPDDVAALASALERLLNDRALASELARRLRARVVADFDWETVMQRYAELLSSPAPAANVRCGESPASR